MKAAARGGSRGRPVEGHRVLAGDRVRPRWHRGPRAGPSHGDAASCTGKARAASVVAPSPAHTNSRRGAARGRAATQDQGRRALCPGGEYAGPEPEDGKLLFHPWWFTGNLVGEESEDGNLIKR